MWRGICAMLQRVCVCVCVCVCVAAHFHRSRVYLGLSFVALWSSVLWVGSLGCVLPPPLFSAAVIRLRWSRILGPYFTPHRVAAGWERLSDALSLCGRFRTKTTTSNDKHHNQHSRIAAKKPMVGHGGRHPLFPDP